MLYEIEGEPSRVLERGAGYLTDEARVEDRIGGGHAEGLFEAWSNLYARFAVAMADADKGAYGDFWYPDVKAAAQGIKWIEQCVESADKGSAVGGLRIIPSTAHPQESSDSISFLILISVIT